MKESLIYGLFGGFIGSLYMGWICSPKSSHQPSLALVDMQELVSKKAQQLAVQLKTNELKDVPLHESANHLKEDLKNFTETHNMVLLAKGAVVCGDVPDMTEEIWDLIEKRGVSQ